MRVIATTVVRESLRGKQRTGYIYDIGWESRSVRRLPVPDPMYPESDDNPRGGVRGGRGVAVTPHGIVVANNDTLLRFDDDWNLLESRSHPLFVGLHEISWDGTHLWLTATRIDAVLKVALDGEVNVAWDPHAPGPARAFRLRPRTHPLDGSLDYRLRDAPRLDTCHINAVSRRENSLVIGCGLVKEQARVAKAKRRAISVGRHLLRRVAPSYELLPAPSFRSVVLRLDGTGAAEVLVEVSGVDFPTHNGCLLDERRVALNDSTQNRLRIFSKGGGELQSLAVPGTWLRGLARVDDRRVLVGTAPATIALIDIEENAIEQTVRLSEDPNEAVHGLTIHLGSGAGPGASEQHS
jgi:hypothetical protein